MKRKIINIIMILILISNIFILTGCGTEENTTAEVENVGENNQQEEGIQVGENILKYGKYEGVSLAEGSTITINPNNTFSYEDNKGNSGTGTYEIRYDEIQETIRTYEMWVIEFDSLEKVSNREISSDYYMLFTQTGDISDEQASLNFRYVE